MHVRCFECDIRIGKAGHIRFVVLTRGDIDLSINAVGPARCQFLKTAIQCRQPTVALCQSERARVLIDKMRSWNW